MRKYDIAKQFSEGFCAALRPEPRGENKPKHWLAGWDAGYGVKSEKNRLLNEYLVSIGSEPMRMVRLCNAERQEPTP